MGFKYTYSRGQYLHVLVLADFGFSMKEISRKTDIPYDTIRGWVKRGYKPLSMWTEEDWARKKANSQATRDNWTPEQRQVFLDKCREPKMGEDNPMWRGDEVGDLDVARARVRRKYKSVIDLLNELSGVKWDIHHIDGNPLNNDDDNLSISTRKGHMIIDGRLEKVRKMFTEMNKTGGD